MPVRRDKDGRWRFRETIRRPDGSSVRINGTAPKHSNTKAAAQQALREEADRACGRAPARSSRDAIRFSFWFNGRFWSEWVEGRKNKPTEVRAKRQIYNQHLAPWF